MQPNKESDMKESTARKVRHVARFEFADSMQAFRQIKAGKRDPLPVEREALSKRLRNAQSLLHRLRRTCPEIFDHPGKQMSLWM